ncbi:tripartite motif-containing protein 35-like [Acanthopagrus latus]|uniref:tripartite motif-containing protein 35-like n=1 Tax=Acanthopagrus latus TaxID=8177 RepID=UPI00187C74B6|nr:tripartite motif-containing protein 35-like [Acanthopagrus latus]
MAGKTSLVESFLNCHACSQTLRDPVSLSCNHSFCSSCLRQRWEQAKNKNCPVCKRKPAMEDSAVNLTLRELDDSFAERRKNGSPETGKEKVLCDRHEDVPYWFCVDEQRAVCPVCEFSLHNNHKLVPVEEAVGELKEQLKMDLKSLQDKRDKYRQVEETYSEVAQHSKRQLLSTERQIRAEFNKLHQFLKEEEESRLASLREEEEQKRRIISREMEEIQGRISSLSQSICAVEEELQKHNVSFLSSYKAAQARARAVCSLSDPRLVSGALIDVAKHLGNLSFRVWEKMKDTVRFCPVILDPNTACPDLYLSDDLTAVRRGYKDQQLPDNPERFTKYATILGSVGFSSGIHSWVVEVGDHPLWHLGVVTESVERKGEISATSENVSWSLSHVSGKYTDGLDELMVTERKSLQRIRVHVDYERGEVSFYDPEDMNHIYTHQDSFTGKLFPFFNVGRAGDAKTTDIKICHADIYL